MTSNLLCLNPSKTEFIVDLREQLKKIPDPSISLNLDSVSTHTFTPTSTVQNLGAICFTKTLAFPITSLIFPALASCISRISATFEESALCSISKLHRSEEHTSELQS